MRNFRTVPWFDSAEWLRVYTALFSSTATGASKHAALRTLLAWKARQPTLVSGVESTLSLLEVEAQADNAAVSEKVVRLAYSAALTRFVNHMLDSEQARGLTLYNAARRAELPDWVIDLRHSAAHGDSLPSLDLLRRAATVAFDWLRRNYWDPQKESISDYVVGSQTISDDNERRLSRMVSFCASLSICSRAEPKIKNLSEIPDEDMRECILQEARELFDSEFPDASSVTMYQLTNLLTSQSTKLMKLYDASAIVNRTLLDSNSLFLSLEVLSFFDEKLFSKNGLSKLYLSSWDILLTMLHNNNLLGSFVEELIGVSNDTERPENVRKLAALWTREILRALRRTEMYINKLKKLKSSGKLPDMSGKKKSHRLLFSQLFPNEKRGLTLNLTKEVPEEFSSFTFIRPIIKCYNPYLYVFIKDLFALLHPKLSSDKEEKFYRLATVISGQNLQSARKQQQIFTMDDVQSENNKENSSNTNSDSDCMQVEIEQYYDDKWKLASDEHDWSKCPIGVLPWQIKCVKCIM